MIYQSNKPVIRFFERIVTDVKEANRNVDNPGHIKIVGHADIDDRRLYIRTYKEFYWQTYEVLFNEQEKISAAVIESPQVSEISSTLSFEVEADTKELFSIFINYVLKVAALKGKKFFIIKYQKGEFSGGQDELLIEEVLREFDFTISNYDEDNMIATRFLDLTSIPIAVNINLKDIKYGDFLGMDYYVTKENLEARNYLYKFIMGELLLSGKVLRPKQDTVTISDLDVRDDNSDYIIKMVEHIMLEYMQLGARVFTLKNQRNYENTIAEAMQRMGFIPEGHLYTLTFNS
jgi:hypothetical protein